ncbi:hypothetical protein HOLleu_45100 [Holothuria leucospilota]|uniref:Uncharacterized protein n=1 Tax=Holothuria leucospilota TaxID=206669 RepID=A0A9Q0YCL5_HOLLE|nr:hypothetical protein HOLleu_45100 [Holothuria leucospilota]
MEEGSLALGSTAETGECASCEPSTTVVSQLPQMVESPPIQPEESTSSQVGEIPSLQTESPLLHLAEKEGKLQCHS